jgi:hypothetical protein
MNIAIDFDGTLCTHEFPNVGKVTLDHLPWHEFIKKANELGHVVILWTCREDLPERPYLQEAVNACTEWGLKLDYVNEYPNPAFHGFASRKVMADYYIDDKAVLFLSNPLDLPL